MKSIFSILLVLTLSTTLFAQHKIYDEHADAMHQIDSAIVLAQRSGRQVLCQVGGNWCPWCLRFAHFADTNASIHKIIHDNYVYIHINYSKENKNPEVMRRLHNPARFGFPVFVILDKEGNPIHIQNSAYLEEGKGYSPKKVEEFLLNWTEDAINTLK